MVSEKAIPHVKYFSKPFSFSPLISGETLSLLDHGADLRQVCPNAKQHKSRNMKVENCDNKMRTVKRN